jgi:phospho-N-acetylmuramoyl-pentapeptide-transferase
MGSEQYPFSSRRDSALARGRIALLGLWTGAMLAFGLLFVPFVILVLTGSSNAVNLTDGLDGLASGLTAFAAVAFGGIAYLTGHARFSEYLNIPFIAGAGELTIFAATVVGAALGFLWWNCPPAGVFMGDTGSLSLGGSLAILAILISASSLRVVRVFVLEAASVMIRWCRSDPRPPGLPHGADPHH